MASPRHKPRRRALAPALVVTVSAWIGVIACSDGDEAPQGTASIVPGTVAGQAGVAGVAGTSGVAGASGGPANASGGHAAGASDSSGGAAGSVGLGGAGGAGGKVAGAAGESSGLGGSPAVGGAAGAVAGSGGAGGEMVNSPDCPSSQPRMSDPCATAGLVCRYDGPFQCVVDTTCKGGRWTEETKKPYVGATCNPPPVCPDEEPSDVDSGSCIAAGVVGPQRCRYARQSCFVYLICERAPTLPRWFEGGYSPAGDSCCPSADLATEGEACANENVTCRGTDGPVICREGKWVPRAPVPGAGGAAGAAGGGMAAGGTTNGMWGGGGAGFGGANEGGASAGGGPP